MFFAYLFTTFIMSLIDICISDFKIVHSLHLALRTTIKLIYYYENAGKAL